MNINEFAICFMTKMFCHHLEKIIWYQGRICPQCCDQRNVGTQIKKTSKEESLSHNIHLGDRTVNFKLQIFHQIMIPDITAKDQTLPCCCLM